MLLVLVLYTVFAAMQTFMQSFVVVYMSEKLKFEGWCHAMCMEWRQHSPRKVACKLESENSQQAEDDASPAKRPELFNYRPTLETNLLNFQEAAE